jgi:hypothetical protein
MILSMASLFRKSLFGMLISAVLCLPILGCGSSPDGEGSIQLVPSTEAIPADGSTSVIIQATIFGTDGEPAPVGTEVRFTTTLGHFADGSQSYGVMVTNDAGTVTVALIAGYEDGYALVTAECNDVTQSLSIQIGTPGSVVGTIKLEADPVNIPADGVSSSTITATISQINGEPVLAGTYVTFTTTLGRFTNGGQTMQVPTIDDTGTVAIALIASTTPGTATITAHANDTSQKIQIYIGASSDTITISTVPVNRTIPADGTSTMTITAIINDVDGTPITPGAAVTFTASEGKFAESGENSITTPAVSLSGGNGATVTLLSYCSTMTHKAIVTCSALAYSKSIEVIYQGDSTRVCTAEANSLESEAKATLVMWADKAMISADGHSSMTVRAEVTTGAGEPAAMGTAVSFSTTLGSFSNGDPEIQAVVADSQGGAQTELFADSVPGQVVITGEALGGQASMYVTFTE